MRALRCGALMNARGVSLKELVISLALGGICMLVLLTLCGLESDVSADIRASSDMVQAIQDARLSLLAPNGCTLNLAGQSLDPAQPAGSTVSELRVFNSSGTLRQTVARAGGTSGGLAFDEIRVKPLAQIDLSVVTAQVEFSSRKLSGFKTALSLRPIGILAQVRGGRIQKCWVRKDERMLVKNSVCKAISGGALNGVGTSGCELVNGQWFSDVRRRRRVARREPACPVGRTAPKTVE